MFLKHVFETVFLVKVIVMFYHGVFSKLCEKRFCYESESRTIVDMAFDE